MGRWRCDFNSCRCLQLQADFKEFSIYAESCSPGGALTVDTYDICVYYSEKDSRLCTCSFIFSSSADRWVSTLYSSKWLISGECQLLLVGSHNGTRRNIWTHEVKKIWFFFRISKTAWNALFRWFLFYIVYIVCTVWTGNTLSHQKDNSRWLTSPVHVLRHSQRSEFNLVKHPSHITFSLFCLQTT